MSRGARLTNPSAVLVYHQTGTLIDMNAQAQIHMPQRRADEALSEQKKKHRRTGINTVVKESRRK